MKIDSLNMFDFGNFDELSYETDKILAPLNYEINKKPLQDKRIQELKDVKDEHPDISLSSKSLSNYRTRQEILKKWKEKRKKLIFKKKKVTCIKKSEYATGFKKRGPNGRFISE